MPDTIYVDVLVIVNFIVNYFLLLALGVLCSLKKDRRRIIMGALCGALFSLSLLFDMDNPFLSLSLRFVLPFIMTFLAFPTRSLKNYLINTFFMFLISFAFGGIMFFLITFFSPKGISCFNGFFYFDINPLTLFILTVICYFSISFCKKIFSEKKPSQEIYGVLIETNGKSAEFEGFLDSGNKLREPFSGFPAAVCELKSLKNILTDEEYEILSQDKFSCPEKFKIIPYKSVGKMGILRGFVPDKFTLHKNGKLFSVDEIIIAVTSDESMNSDFNIILPADIIFETREKTIQSPGSKKERF